MPTMLKALACPALALAIPIGGALAEDAPQPLAFVVRPSGIEPGETLDEKLARRERGFRFICIGCVRMPGAPPSSAPFEPLRTLNAPGLSQALAEPRSELPPEPPVEP